MKFHDFLKANAFTKSQNLRIPWNLIGFNYSLKADAFTKSQKRRIP